MRPLVIVLGVGLLAAGGPAVADDWVPPVTHELTRQECGECHMAFQPAFLPARSWDAIMDGLNDHFGDDASLKPAQVEAIRAYLTANAGDRVSGRTARKFMRYVVPLTTPLRITDNPYFLKEHRFPESVWRRPDVVSKVNCTACHRQAEMGNFDD